MTINYLHDLINESRLANAPGKERRRRVLYTVMLRAPENPTKPANRPPRAGRGRRTRRASDAH
ncbi:MAG: hypothetical protein ACRDFX_00045 [Chloroflexota bacterium]